VDLAFQVEGPLVELPVNEGDRVSQGQLIARIRTSDFQTRLDNSRSALESAQSQLAAMKAGAREEDRRTLEAQLSAAQAKFAEASAQYNRAKNLLQEGVTTQSKFDEVEATYGVARAQLDAAHKELEKGLVGARIEDIQAKEADIKGLQAALDEATLRLGDTELLAPFDGIIASRFVENFQNVQAKQAIVSLQDISRVEVVINLPENDVIRASTETVGQIYARFDAIRDATFPLKIKEFGTQADPTTQTYPATLSMDPPEGVNILPGMTAQVSVEFLEGGMTAGNYFLVPATAVFSEGTNDNFVWKIDSGSMTATKTPVKVGALNGEDIEIGEGLSTGDTVAAAGVHHLREGMKVRRLNN
jgi:RND family efflux transporter MFP subunit